MIIRPDQSEKALAVYLFDRIVVLLQLRGIGEALSPVVLSVNRRSHGFIADAHSFDGCADVLPI